MTVVVCLLAAICVLLPGCRDTLVSPEELDPEPREVVERTVIFYMAADNSLSNQVENDTTEMVKARHLIPKGVNVVIYLDDKTSKPAIYELSRAGGMKLWKRYEEELNSMDADVMYDVLHTIKHYFPANHYGITFWSHGTGWIPQKQSVRRKTFGEDWHRGSSASGKLEMEIPALRDVLAHFPKFDYIFFDACFMQCIEVAYELRNVTNYMVSSPAEIPGPGAPYHLIIDALCKGDAKGIVEGYGNGYPGTYNGFYYPGVLLSCIDCTQLEPLAIETGRLLTPFYMEHAEPYATGFQSYCDLSWNRFTYCFDMRTTMCRLLSEEDYAAWLELYNKAVSSYKSLSNGWFAIHCQTTDGVKTILADPNCYGGVSMFVPMVKYDNNNCSWNQDFQQTSWYQALGWGLTGW